MVPTKVESIGNKTWPEILRDAAGLKTHFGLVADDIVGIGYDYEGPGGAQRKTVRTKVGTFIYVSYRDQWQIVENQAA